MCIFEFSHFSFNTNGIFIAESKIKIVDMLLVITVILTIRETDSPKAGGINPKKNIRYSLRTNVSTEERFVLKTTHGVVGLAKMNLNLTSVRDQSTNYMRV